MNPRDAANRGLLIGLLALQNGLVDQEGLLLAFRAWIRDKSRPIAEILNAQGVIDADDRALLEALAAKHLKRHGGDADQSLAAFNVGASTRATLAKIDDQDIEATVAQVCSASEDGDASSAVTFQLSGAASSGQRFRLLRPHARGGLGAVFVALDEELHREVALKQILDHHADDPSSRARFVLEAEITGGLEHPGIVPVYGLGADGDGRPYYAMRFIRGDSLKETIAAFHADPSLTADPSKRSLELHKLLRRFGDVCNAIDYAHTRGVLHRDIKPANIIVGKHGETLIVDWGLAKVLGKSEPDFASDERVLTPSSASGSAETLPGSALGTPAYMSPEQSVGDLDQLGPRSDVYSLGATLYCVLTGKPPFDGDDMASLLRSVQKGAFPAPRKLDPSIDQALEAVCLKAMATNPADRYATPRALADDVDRWMADEPVGAWREPRTRALLRWVTRHRVRVTAAAAAGLVALVGLAGVGAVQTRANLRLASKNIELNRANLREAAANSRLVEANGRVQARLVLAMDAIKAFHTGVSEDFLLKEKHFERLRKTLLTRAAEFYGKLGSLLKDQGDQGSRAALASAYSELAALTRTIGSARNALELSHQALELQRALAKPRGAGAQTQLELLKALVVEGRLRQATDDTTGALAILKEGAEVGEELVRTNPSGEARHYLGRCYLAMASNYLDMSRADEALKAQTRAGDIFQTLVNDNPGDLGAKSSLANSHFTRGYMLSVYLNKPRDALESLEFARRIEKEIGAADPERTEYRRVLSEIDSMLGVHRLSQGETELAFAVLSEGRDVIEKLVAAEPNVTLFQTLHGEILGNLGFVHAKKGDLPKAIEAQRRSCDIMAKLVEANPGDGQLRRGLGGGFNNIGDFELASGRLDPALASYTSAKGLIEPLVKAQPRAEHYEFGLAFSLAGLGRVHTRLGKIPEAAAELRGSSAIWHRLSASSLESRYTCAGDHALLAGLGGVEGSGVSLRESEVEAKRAVAELKTPIRSGYRTISELRGDVDFHSLKGRDDFESLLKDLAFPAQPFVPDR
jgi:eukaryotic-like serine/threonine-protein kinase